ncbi:MAG: DUF2953 domain-containing protein [Oscillospiraceae bacterium]|jgi:hypothetical protein|nr:DUF2953 domain-containing protein [Oscillospiraceae bacterium]
MLALGILFSVFLLIGFTRVGARVRRPVDGALQVTLRVGLLRLNLLKMVGKASKKPKKPEKPKKKQKAEKPAKRTVSLPVLFGEGRKLLRTLRKSVRFDRLIVSVTFGAGDPCDAALNYGRSHMVLALLRPAVLSVLRVKRQDIAVALDYDMEKFQWCCDICVTISVGRIFLLTLSLLGIMIKVSGRKKG